MAVVMLCASGFEFKEKLRLASMEREAAQRSLAVAAVPSDDFLKRIHSHRFHNER
jgi:hypothetical protein